VLLHYPGERGLYRKGDEDSLGQLSGRDFFVIFTGLVLPEAVQVHPLRPFELRAGIFG